MNTETAQARYDLILKGGRVIDERNGLDAVLDVAIRGRTIAAIGKDLASEHAKIRDVSGCIVAPGLIDLHTHVYHKATSLSIDPAMIARRSALTTLVDAGSAGAGNFDGLRDFVMAPSPYRILAFLNISFAGIFGFEKGVFVGEATERKLLSVPHCVAKIEANRDRIVGVKVRVGGSVTGDLALGALELALEAADKAGLPLMTHIGGPPPTYAEVVSMLRPGDILTHCYRPDPNSAIAPDGGLLPEVIAARERGVLFDIAHGMGAFGYESADAARVNGFLPDVISSDVHTVCVDGPAYDLLHTMSKLLNWGMTLPQVVAAATSRPALAMQRPELGHLGIGGGADITVLRQVAADFVFSDVRGVTRAGDTLLQPVASYRDGQEMEISRRPFEESAILHHHEHCHHHCR